MTWMPALPSSDRNGHGVASGTHASVTWPGRSAGTEYEWYVDVSDGSKTTTGSTWSFTTAIPTHTVTFDPNGGTGTLATQVANVPTALTANTFTRAGFTFAGWGRLRRPGLMRMARPTPWQQMSRCMPSGRRCRPTP